MPTRRVIPQHSFQIAVGIALLGLAFPYSSFLFGQSKAPTQGSAAASLASVQEFPVTMLQNVKAGKTPVGTKVEAKLTIATLVGGAVLPEGAIFSGEVVESAAKSSSDPSRIAIRMDSVQWKNGSKPITVYLTAWYYPLQMGMDADHEDCRSSGSLGMNCPIGITTPGTRIPPDALPPPPIQISKSRVAMKDVESTRNADGAIELTSIRSDLKLDKTTTYVLATGDLTAGKNTDVKNNDKPTK
jgi:hypothetical protein